MTTQTQVRSTEEALKLALDWCYCLEDGLSDEGVLWHVRVRTLLTDLVPAIKEALAQPAVSETHKQEPVAWMQDTTCGLYVIDHPDEWHCIPLYTTQPPVTESHKRKPLTVKQRNEIARQADENDWHDYDIIDAVEAAHGIMSDTDGKEKNT